MTTLPHLHRPTDAPAGFTRMANGQVVRAQTDFGNTKPANQKLLIVLQYYDGDMNDMEDVANIICDLERVRNKDADILLFGRFDAKPFPSHSKSKLLSKFDKVHEVQCRARDGKSYPFASNCMFYDLVTLLGQYEQWNRPYFAFLNLESDCVPLHPGWIRELANEFKTAQAHGKQAIGHIYRGAEAPEHMNGVAVYAIDIFHKVAGAKLRGGKPNVAYDLYQAPNILPLAEDTALIQMVYRQPTITKEELFRHHKGAVEPAIYHGVKDASAREAVRARHITFSEKKDLSRSTVFAYYDSAHDVGHGQRNEEIDLWRQAWQSRGWNPVVLRLMDASRNGRFQELDEAIKKLPYVGDKNDQRKDMIRWAALATIGGGFMVDLDQLPNAFTPNDLNEDLRFSKTDAEALVKAIIEYLPTDDDKLNGNPHVSDETILNTRAALMDSVTSADIGAPEYKSANLVNFSDRALRDSPYRGKRKSDVIREYLRGAI